ncbi:GNAT family N-acetyltransferase [Streptomyces sp. ISL-36]|uniref:GNAT family N-acetyltransferase n=1 Tax=Streptomyces sp. ISL-36 TaxID=2819182 RepID=UPI001BED1DCC|nr:GNAT family N-acetyltransferase [Streptomyces sp. ISL-36]MBT2439926.1 GNAT family N-acetyltransferase [Streptomyces sp. ISL-36]
MVITVSPVLDVTLRLYTPADESAVVELINADRLPGQPHATPGMLKEALKGRSPVDAGWWAELDSPVTQVAVYRAGAVIGAVSYALRPKDRTGQLLWLHCRERQDVADALIRHTVAAFEACPVHAFHFASALSLGLEALPVRHRPATVAAVERAGFTGQRLWRYMRADLPAHGLPHLTHVKVGPDPGGKDARRLEARKGRRTVAEAVVGLPVQGTGVLWWIGVEPHARGQGLGRAMLGSALDVLAGLGATEAILYVDDDAPPGDERDRTAANALYESAGFAEVDRLHSYILSTSS